MKKEIPFDFWYAVNNTEIVTLPSRHLETFGTTIVNYHMVSELMDAVNQIRVREGRMLASRPQIVTPEAYSQTMLEGFGEEAGKYVDWLKEHEKQVRILQYGYELKQESFSEHVVTDNMKSVVERVKATVKESGDPLGAILIGVGRPWDVCLIKLFWEVITSSAKTNIEDLERRHMFDTTAGGVPMTVRHEIETAFLEASRNPGLINALAERLQKRGLLEEYQDRFFALVKASKR